MFLLKMILLLGMMVGLDVGTGLHAFIPIKGLSAFESVEPVFLSEEDEQAQKLIARESRFWHKAIQDFRKQLNQIDQMSGQQLESELDWKQFGQQEQDKRKAWQKIINPILQNAIDLKNEEKNAVSDPWLNTIRCFRNQRSKLALLLLCEKDQESLAWNDLAADGILIDLQLKAVRGYFGIDGNDKQKLWTVFIQNLSLLTSRVMRFNNLQVSFFLTLKSWDRHLNNKDQHEYELNDFEQIASDIYYCVAILEKKPVALTKMHNEQRLAIEENNKELKQAELKRAAHMLAQVQKRVEEHRRAQQQLIADQCTRLAVPKNPTRSLSPYRSLSPRPAMQAAKIGFSINKRVS
jgi:hypothetical protein